MKCDFIKRKCFFDTSDKDEVERIRHKEDYELKESSVPSVGRCFPSYDANVVLESFTERDEKVNRKFFSSKWEKIKQNIVGQTMWVIGIYIICYYLVQILFVQSAVNACGWFGQNSTQPVAALDPTQPNAAVLPVAALDPTQPNAAVLTVLPVPDPKIACAKKFATFVKSWEAKQKR